MLLKIENPKILSDIVGIISELVTEVKIRVNPNGLSIVAIDPANVALVSFNLPASSFSKFEADEETIGISLSSFKSVLRRAGITSNIILKTEDNTLTIEIYDKIKKVFNLALIDIEAEDKAVPTLEFTSKIEMSSYDFSEAIEDCAIVADSCSFLVKDGKFVIEGKGLNSAKSEFSNEEIKIDAQDGKSRYSLEYLQKFAKASKISDRVSIGFSDDYPLKLVFVNAGVELSFILAPRVETED